MVMMLHVIYSDAKPKLIIGAIKQCTSIRGLKSIQAHMFRTGLAEEPSLTTCLIESPALTLPHHLPYAHSIFSSTQFHTLFVWNKIIRGYSLSDSPITAIKLFRDMLLCGIMPNSFTLGFVLKACCRLSRSYEGKLVHSLVLKMGLNVGTPVFNGLLKLYMNCGCVDSARQVFDEMRDRDRASWCVMISGLVKNGFGYESLELFREMQVKGVDMDEYTLASVVGICGHLGALDMGKWVHSYIDQKSVKVDVVLGTCLVDMYSKCGSLQDALEVFEEMSDKDVTAWSAMIGGCAVHGNGHKALELFNDMKRANVRPNCVTFTSVFSACSHSGLVDEGCRYFDSMQSEYGIVPQLEHYGCMTDLFCRAGLVVRAHEFIKNMRVEPNVVLWRTLLVACKTHGFKDLGKQISRHILELEPQGGNNYVLVSNVYASLGRWSNVRKIRSLMKGRNVKKEHGWSSIEVNFIMHQFVMGDESHPERDEIYQMLDEMARKLSQKGHIVTTSDVLHDIDEEEKEHALCLHSERLAIAYGLLRLPKESTIRIVKNLRVCRDCHSAIELISAIYKRYIIVRDRVRFHHFSEGKCSCNGYW